MVSTRTASNDEEIKEIRFVSGVVGTEQRWLVDTPSSAPDCAFRALAQFCSVEGHPYAETRATYNPVLDTALVAAFKPLTFCGTLSDRLGEHGKLTDKWPKFRNMFQ